MIRAPALNVQRETPLRHLAHEQFITDLQLVNLWCQFALRHQLKEKFDFVFVRRRHNRVRSLQSFVNTLHAQRGVLARYELELATGLDADGPQLGREVDALGDGRVVVLIFGAHGSYLVKTSL